MSTHHGANEVGVISVRGIVVVEVARLDIVGGRSNRSDSYKGDKCSERLHVVVNVRLWKERPGYRDMSISETPGRR